MIFKYFLSEFFSLEPMVENCSEACQLGKACVCSFCKCCNKCTSSYANTGEDAPLQGTCCQASLLSTCGRNFCNMFTKCRFTFSNLPHLGQWRPPLTHGLLLRMSRMKRRKGGMAMQCMLCLRRSRMDGGGNWFWIWRRGSEWDFWAFLAQWSYPLQKQKNLKLICHKGQHWIIDM